MSSYNIALGTSTYIAASKKKKGRSKLRRELSYGDRDVESLLLLKRKKNLQLMELAINGKTYNLRIIRKTNPGISLYFIAQEDNQTDIKRTRITKNSELHNFFQIYRIREINQTTSTNQLYPFQII